MGGGYLHRPGPEGRVDGVVGHDRCFPIGKGEPGSIALPARKLLDIAKVNNPAENLVEDVVEGGDLVPGGRHRDSTNPVQLVNGPRLGQ